MQAIGEGVDVFAQAHQAFPHFAHRFASPGAVPSRLNAADVDREPRHALRDVVVQFAGEPGALHFLRVQQPPAEFARGVLGLFPLGDVPHEAGEERRRSGKLDPAHGEVHGKHRTILAPAADLAVGSDHGRGTDILKIKRILIVLVAKGGGNEQADILPDHFCRRCSRKFLRSPH